MHESSSSETHLARRDFVATLATLGGIGGAALASCASTQPRHAAGARGSIISTGDTVLFQGDSITDSSRSRETAAQANTQSALGGGYAWLAASGLLVDRPADQLSIYNRGISGHRVPDLAERWERDCLQLNPDVLSILIGVNDVWHAREGNYVGDAETYAQAFDALLSRTREALPDLQLIICEPFVLECGSVDASWFPDFDTYRAAAKRMARKHRATWVPFQEMFDKAIQYAPAEHWAEDGVHPSAAGAALMAQTWLRATEHVSADA
ncbi:MAG: lysophospholipase L1-like esterase [Chlamydiales bacterium]|jgi:lysophospholipase L1-like esterase